MPTEGGISYLPVIREQISPFNDMIKIYDC